MKTLAILILSGVLILPSMAEDWTVKGKTYHNVSVTKVDPDVVHIIYDGGAGSVSLADLPADMQKKFNYDPVKAKAAADEEAQKEAQNDQIVAQETAKKNAADAVAQAQENQDEAAKQLTSSAKRFFGAVVQKTDGGYLVHYQMAMPVVSDDAAVGGGGGFYTAPIPPGPPLLPSGTYFIVTSKDYVDGDHMEIVVYPAGEYSYTDTQGAQCTVRRYADTPQAALALSSK